MTIKNYWLEEKREWAGSLAATKKGWALKYTENPSEEVQLDAVKENGYAIKLIENPSDEVCLAAIEYDSEVVEWIKNPSERVCLAAIKKNWAAIQFIKNPSEEVQLAAVRQNWIAVGYIAYAVCENAQLEAVDRGGIKALNFIFNPCEKVKEIKELLDKHLSRIIVNAANWE